MRNCFTIIGLFWVVVVFAIYLFRRRGTQYRSVLRTRFVTGYEPGS